jgi:hypothetical protein
MFSGQYTAPELDDLAGPIVTSSHSRFDRGFFGAAYPVSEMQSTTSTGLLPRAPRVPVDESGGEHWSPHDVEHVHQ